MFTAPGQIYSNMAGSVEGQRGSSSPPGAPLTSEAMRTKKGNEPVGPQWHQSVHSVAQRGRLELLHLHFLFIIHLPPFAAGFSPRDAFSYSYRDQPSIQITAPTEGLQMGYSFHHFTIIWGAPQSSEVNTSCSRQAWDPGGTNALVKRKVAWSGAPDDI